MEETEIMEYLKKMLKEQLCCLGRIFARHEVADDVVWEVVKGLDLIHQRIVKQAGCLNGEKRGDPDIHKMEPHPGITYLLEKIGK
jgi:hypothetical protein